MTRPAFTPAPVVLLSALVLAPLVAACGVKDTQAQSPVAPEIVLTVKTAPVLEQTLARTLTLTGTLVPSRESAVAADVTGKVAQIYVERGSRVAAGAPLVRLDRRQAALMEEEARSQAAAIAAQATLATSECARSKTLFAEGAINQAEFDRSQAACAAAGQSAMAARAREQLAGKTLGDLVVRAPFAGVVADRFVNPGEYVRPDSRVASVVQLGQLRLEIGVPESALAAFGVGAEVSFKVAAYPAEIFTGRVRYVGATVRRQSRDLLVDALVVNADERLRPGMFAVAEVTLGQATLPVVPRSALRSDERAGTDRLFVVAEGRAVERLVHKGELIPGASKEEPVLVAIHGGVKPGERVVLEPDPALRDGARVK